MPIERCCQTCGQPFPVAPRRDPPLPPLDHPAVVTIHDLPAGERAEVEVTMESRNSIGLTRVLQLKGHRP